MKIIITGALGYIGSETLLRFVQRPDITIDGADTSDYNVEYAKLRAIWPNYNKTFDEQMLSIVEYYK